MDRRALLEAAESLPRWVRVALAIRAARMVQGHFAVWMEEATHITAVEQALRFAEECAVLGGSARIPLNLPDQVSLVAMAAADAARSTWEDDMDPDARPAAYATAAYAAASAAETAAYAVLATGDFPAYGVKSNAVKALETAIASQVKADTMRWFASLDAVREAETRAEQAFVNALGDELHRLQSALVARLDDRSGVPWELFCAANPVSVERGQPQATTKGFLSAFISYSHRDATFARRLFEELRGRGVECWLDERRMYPGERILDAVANAINRSQRLLLCCSRDALESWWVKDEIRKAQEKERDERVNLIVPLLLDRYLLDEWADGLAADLRSRLAADFIGWARDENKFEASLKQVLHALKTP